MKKYTISAETRAELWAAHRGTRDQREADRIKAVVLPARTFMKRSRASPRHSFAGMPCSVHRAS
jgi:hypothetical protein